MPTYTIKADRLYRAHAVLEVQAESKEEAEQCVVGVVARDDYIWPKVDRMPVDIIEVKEQPTVREIEA